MPLPKASKGDYTSFLVEIIWHPEPYKTLRMLETTNFYIIRLYNKVIKWWDDLPRSWMIHPKSCNEKIDENQWPISS